LPRQRADLRDARMNSRPEFSRWENDGLAREPGPRKALRLLLIVAVHVALVAGALTLLVRPELITEGERLYIRLVEEAPRMEPQPPAVEKPKPPIARPETVRRIEPPPSVLAAPSDTAAPASFAVPTPPPSPAPPAAPVAAAPPVVIEATYDADYLHNPKPEYPVIARRLGNEGKVLLRVRVSAEGNPLVVEVGQSSGFVSLDEAARDAVQRWRFVPARRGSEAIESWVGVPIVFRLDH
jgi:protein TonB